MNELILISKKELLTVMFALATLDKKLNKAEKDNMLKVMAELISVMQSKGELQIFGKTEPINN